MNKLILFGIFSLLSAYTQAEPVIDSNKWLSVTSQLISKDMCTGPGNPISKLIKLEEEKPQCIKKTSEHVIKCASIDFKEDFPKEISSMEMANEWGKKLSLCAVKKIMDDPWFMSLGKRAFEEERNKVSSPEKTTPKDERVTEPK